MRLLFALVSVAFLAAPAPAAHAGAPALAPVYLGSEPLAFSLEADFQKLFRERDPDNSEKAILRYFDPLRGGDIELTVDVRVRGNTSLLADECSFPKISIEFRKEKELKGTIFEGAIKIRLGTHCGELPDAQATPNGRLANQKSPVRENLAHQILSLLAIPAQHSRLAEVTYIESGTGRKTTRHAQMLEDFEAIARRLGGRIQRYRDNPLAAEPSPAPQLPEIFSDARSEDVDLDELASVYLFQALIGNYDWSVKVSASDEAPHSFDNVRAVKIKGGKTVIIPYDFDKAASVTGRIERSPDYPPKALTNGNKDVLFNYARLRIDRARELFSKTTMKKQESHFSATRPAILSAIDRSHVDEDGKALMRRHVEAFFAALGSH